MLDLGLEAVMDWELLWESWYCLGRQQHPGVAVAADAFERYLRGHRTVLEGKAEPFSPIAPQAYLVAGALAGTPQAAAGLLDLRVLGDHRLEDALARVARRHCPAHAADVVAELLFRWYAGTPKNPTPLLARWPPTGDFARYFLTTIKRLAVARSRQGDEFVSFQTVGNEGRFRPALSASAPPSSEAAARTTEFVDCFAARLGKLSHARRKLCIVAIATQSALDAPLRQKQIADVLGVSEPTVTRDIQAITAAQEACIEAMHLEDEAGEAWWWADVRSAAAEHSAVCEAVQELLADDADRLTVADGR